MHNRENTARNRFCASKTLIARQPFHPLWTLATRTLQTRVVEGTTDAYSVVLGSWDVGVELRVDIGMEVTKARGTIAEVVTGVKGALSLLRPTAGPPRLVVVTSSP